MDQLSIYLFFNCVCFEGNEAWSEAFPSRKNLLQHIYKLAIILAKHAFIFKKPSYDLRNSLEPANIPLNTTTNTTISCEKYVLYQVE